jgi:hypothetical protein
MTDARGLPKLTAADLVLVNAMGALVARQWTDVPRAELMEEVIRDVLPHVNRGHPSIGKLAAVADRMLEQVMGTQGRGWPALRNVAGDHLADFFEWRTGEAQAVWRQQHAEERT